MCPTSHLQTGAAASYAGHPIGLLRRLYFRVTVNTDNRLMSGTSMSREFGHLVEAFGYGLDDLAWFTVNAMKSAFMPFDERLAMDQRGDQARLRGAAFRMAVRPQLNGKWEPDTRPAPERASRPTEVPSCATGSGHDRPKKHIDDRLRPKSSLCAFRPLFATLRSHFVTGCVMPRPNRGDRRMHMRSVTRKAAVTAGLGCGARGRRRRQRERRRR